MLQEFSLEDKELVCEIKKKSIVKIKSLCFGNAGTGVLFGFQRISLFFLFKTFFIILFLGLESQEFLGIVWDLLEFLGLGVGLGLNSENFGIGTGIEIENFWIGNGIGIHSFLTLDWDWDSFYLNLGLGLGLGFFCRPLHLPI